MKKIIIILTLFSIAVSQGKMILKTGEEIVLKEKINLSDFNSNSSYINQNSKYYSKSKVALAVSSEGEILFRSGMSISKYNSLSIVKKAKADNKFSSVGFKNINYALLGNLNEEETQIYLKSYGNTVSSPGKSFGIFAGACSVVMIAIIFSSPYFMSAGLG